MREIRAFFVHFVEGSKYLVIPEYAENENVNRNDGYWNY
jgi:hypothetical protein